MTFDDLVEKATPWFGDAAVEMLTHLGVKELIGDVEQLTAQYDSLARVYASALVHDLTQHRAEVTGLRNERDELQRRVESLTSGELIAALVDAMLAEPAALAWAMSNEQWAAAVEARSHYRGRVPQ